MLHFLLSTESNWTGSILRLTLGGVLFPHAVQKLFGWFNGPGLSGEIQFMTTQAGMSSFTAVLAITVECLGAFLILTGAGTRLAALGLFGLFIGIISTWHYRNGFFMNWFGQLPAGKEGFEYHLLVLGLCAALFLEGGGRWSVDQWLSAQ